MTPRHAVPREDFAKNPMEACFIPYNLRFFDEGDKTGQPTARKKEKAREEGQVAKSQEIGTAFLFLAGFFALRSFSGWMLEKISAIYIFCIDLLKDIDILYTEEFLSEIIWYLFLQALLVAAPIFAVAMVVGLIVNIVQVGWHPTTKPMRPKLSKLNPLSGLKRLFSFRVLMDLLKSLAKFGVIGYAIYSMIQKEIDNIPALLSLGVIQSVSYIGNLIVNLGLNVGMLFIFVAAVDYAYNRFKHNKDLKMTKQEVKEEYKNIEGNPQIKGKIKQKMREASMRRMMQDVPKADVIITNPTHYAVAIRYDRENMEVPVVVAKGMDFLARRIKDEAAKHGVEIVENVQLARALYDTVDIGREIPPELYQAVAEILAFVYKLKNKVS